MLRKSKLRYQQRTDMLSAQWIYLEAISESLHYLLFSGRDTMCTPKNNTATIS